MTYRFGQTTYQIKVENPALKNQPEQRVFLDGHLQPDSKIPLQDDKGDHQVEIKWE
jgi:cellobiose phosphorylase